MGNKPSTVADKFAELEQRLVADMADEAESFAESVRDSARTNLALGNNDASNRLALTLLTTGQPYRTERADGTDISIVLPPEYKYLEYGTGVAGQSTDDARGDHQFYRAPSAPPVEPIQEWIDEKGVEPRDPEMSARQLAYVIAKQISELGNEAHPFLRPAFYERYRLFSNSAGDDGLGQFGATLEDVF